MKDINTLENNADMTDSLGLSNTQENIIREYDMKHLDLKSLGLSEKDMSKIHEVKQSFGEVNTLTIADYGKGISSRSAEYTKDILTLVQNKDLDVVIN